MLKVKKRFKDGGLLKFEKGGVAEYGGSFSQAFAKARKDGHKTFKWNNGYYGTALANETNSGSATNVGLNKSGDIVVTAPRLKITNKTSGFVPVDSKEYVDKDGRSRIHYQYDTGRYYVVDNTGNIVGTSTNEKARQPGFKEWEIYEPWTEGELQKANQIEISNRAALNQSNQLIQNEKHREQMGNHPVVKAVDDGRKRFVNVVMQAVSTPDHALYGGLKAMLDPNYSAQDYVRGFNINPDGHTPGRITGAASALGVEGLARVIGDAATSVYTFPSYAGMISNQIAKHIPAVRYDVVKGKPANIPTVNKSWHQGDNTVRYGSTHPYTPKSGHNYGATVTKMDSYIPRIVEVSGAPKPTLLTPYHPIVSEVVKDKPYPVRTEQTVYEYSPTDQRDQLRTMVGRIMTGDFVPGTTAPKWDGPKGTATTKTDRAVFSRGRINTPTNRTDKGERVWFPYLQPNE